MTDHAFFYCHGLPGSRHELTVLWPDAPSRPHVLAAGTRSLASKTPAHLIGFSLGAAQALRLAASQPDVVARLTLIAPAAPLELGNFLPSMAGKAVFEMAQRGERAFALFTRAQSFGARIAPNTIIKAMFKGSPKADQDMISDTAFKAALTFGLRQSLSTNRTAYQRAVQDYVQPWADILPHVACPVHIHHGRADNCAPATMSEALAQNITGPTEVSYYDDLGHYSTLAHVLPRLISPVSP